jgi:hypothetical protein
LVEEKVTGSFPLLGVGPKVKEDNIDKAECDLEVLPELEDGWMGSFI